MRKRYGWVFLGCLLSATLAWSELTLASEENAGEKTTTDTGEYLELKPAIIVNFGGVGPIHFLKAEIALRVGKKADTSITVQHHLPYIRHTLVMLLSRQTDETLSTMQGKEQIREEALAAVQKVLQEEEGQPLVEDLLFNNLIVQR
jgi:flagellar FliL protein